MNQTRDHVVIRGIGVLHETARRDWVCGECGGRLRTVWNETEPHWLTICANDPDHEQDGFIHKQSWAWREHERLAGEAQAEDVFDHLLAEMQAAIEGQL